VRVDASELQQIKEEVLRRGEPYRDRDDLSGAMLDCEHALVSQGFTEPNVIEVGEPERMVQFRSVPDWSPVSESEIIERLERGWAKTGAFSNEAHSIVVEGECVTMDFVTWWDGGSFYTGRIEITHARRGLRRSGPPSSPRTA
jgi:hypothetical protein